MGSKVNCGSCLFFIPRCRDRDWRIRAVERYTKYRYRWIRKFELMYENLDDGGGICMVKGMVVHASCRACRSFVNRSRALRKLSTMSTEDTDKEYMIPSIENVYAVIA